MATKHFVDTHAFLWFLAGSARLGNAAKAILQDPTSALFLPATALAEACWIVERGRVALAVTDVLGAIDNDPRTSTRQSVIRLPGDELDFSEWNSKENVIHLPAITPEAIYLLTGNGRLIRLNHPHLNL